MKLAPVPGGLDERRLECQAPPEEVQLVLACPTDPLEHAFHAAHAEAAGHQQSVIRAEQLAPSRLVGKPIGRDPIDLHAAFDQAAAGDRKSTRLNSSHLVISYAVFCLKKKKSK